MAAPYDPRFLALQQALIGRYSLERELGRGGMGTVYLARDVRLDRVVAIKVLNQDLSARSGARERFLQEARLAARLAHPHIVPIYSAETIGELVVIVMGLVDGETLGARIRRRGPLPTEVAERLLREVGWALGYAHARGVIHRDLTLENIMLEHHSGRALLADFGIAREQDSAAEAPVFGTPGYLAPEVIRGEQPDARADLYALGVVGYTALAGRAPFVGDRPSEVLAKHLVQPVPSLAPLARGASRRLVSAVEMCLAKSPDDRPADSAAFLSLLERAPEPIAIAPALRTWFTRWDRIRPIYALATPILAMQTWLLVGGYLKTGSQTLLTLAAVTAILTTTAIPVAAHLLFEFFELRRLRQLGFGVEDIRTAAPHWREELQRDHRRRATLPLASRVIFDLTVFGGFLLVMTYIVIGPNLFWLGKLIPGLARYFEGMGIVAVMAYFWTMIGIGVGFASPGIRLSPTGKVRGWIERFWQSRFATRLGTMAGAGQHARLAATSTLHRPTEMVLGLAVDDLWAAIPAAARAELGDVPQLAHMLRSSASELRDLSDRLRASERELADIPDEVARLVSTREGIDRRLRETVSMLERLRLQLLHLLATKTQTADLTSQIEAARLLEADLIRDVASHAEVRRLLRRTAPRTATPTPRPSMTPA